MKLNRFIALAAIALLVVGGMGTIATRSLAASKTAVSAQSQSCDQQGADTAEVADAADTDNVDVQCGDQVEDGQLDSAESVEGSVAAEPASNEANESAALQGKAAITAADAESAALAANPGASVVKTELDDENGIVVYSVELSNGANVKVDATNGSLHTTDSGADSEG